METSQQYKKRKALKTGIENAQVRSKQGEKVVQIFQ
jgi:hypothetical protein